MPRVLCTEKNLIWFFVKIHREFYYFLLIYGDLLFCWILEFRVIFLKFIWKFLNDVRNKIFEEHTFPNSTKDCGKIFESQLCNLVKLAKQEWLKLVSSSKMFIYKTLSVKDCCNIAMKDYCTLTTKCCKRIAKSLLQSCCELAVCLF